MVWKGKKGEPLLNQEYEERSESLNRLIVNHPCLVCTRLLSSRDRIHPASLQIASIQRTITTYTPEDLDLLANAQKEGIQLQTPDGSDLTTLPFLKPFLPSNIMDGSGCSSSIGQLARNDRVVVKPSINAVCFPRSSFPKSKARK